MLCLLNNFTFDRSLEKAILYAVGNTLVCDGLEEAKILSWSGERYKGKCSAICFIKPFFLYAVHMYVVLKSYC